jgi:hypothetical protein
MARHWLRRPRLSGFHDSVLQTRISIRFMRICFVLLAVLKTDLTTGNYFLLDAVPSCFQFLPAVEIYQMFYMLQLLHLFCLF